MPSMDGLLSSDAKCNTPRQVDIGKVVQDLKERCHGILFASVGGRKETRDRAGGGGGSFTGCGGRSRGLIARTLRSGAKATISVSCSGTHFGRVLRRFTLGRGAINCRMAA